MNMNPVEKLMLDLGAGRVTLDDAAEQLPGLLKPRRLRRPATTPTEMWEREADSGNLPPHTPGSWDDVEAAYLAHDVITEAQYEQLLRRVTRPQPVMVD